MREPYILFTVAGATYAIRSGHVQQIEMVENITLVPKTPGFVDGIVYLRGQVVPVMNLRARFGMERIPYDLVARLIVVHLDNRVVGLAVDQAREFTYLSSEEFRPPPDTVKAPGVEYLEAVVSLEDRLILIMDLEHLLSKDEKEELDNEGEIAPRGEA